MTWVTNLDDPSARYAPSVRDSLVCVLPVARAALRRRHRPSSREGASRSAVYTQVNVLLCYTPRPRPLTCASRPRLPSCALQTRAHTHGTLLRARALSDALRSRARLERRDLDVRFRDCHGTSAHRSSRKEYILTHRLCPRYARGRRSREVYESGGRIYVVASCT